MSDEHRITVEFSMIDEVIYLVCPCGWESVPGSGDVTVDDLVARRDGHMAAAALRTGRVVKPLSEWAEGS